MNPLKRQLHPPRQWELPNDHFIDVLSGTRTVNRVYENEWALAFHDVGSHLDAKWENNLVVITKRQIESLMDLGVADLQVWAGLLDCIQGAAKMLGLDEQGFTMKINVLPPYQHTPRIHIHMFSGESSAGKKGGHEPGAGEE